MKLFTLFVFALVSLNIQASEESARKCLVESAMYTNAFIEKSLNANKTLKPETRKHMIKRLHTENSYGRTFRETLLEQCLEEGGLMRYFLKMKNDSYLHRYELEDLGH